MSVLEQKTGELRMYKPELTRQPDFEEFWEMAMAEFFPRQVELDCSSDDPIIAGAKTTEQDHRVSEMLKLEEILFPIKSVQVSKVLLEASDGTMLHGWYLCPREGAGQNKVPGLVRFHGYSSNKGNLAELLPWALQGYAILSMDIRGQCGNTPDARVYSSGSFSGWMTRGLDSPLEYYYRQVYLDCVQAIEALARRTEVDASRIGLFGNSQGGGLAIIAAALITHFRPRFPSITARIQAVSAGIPFLADMREAYQNHSEGPWQEFDSYFRMSDPLHEREEGIFRVLSYFDAMNFAPWVDCPASLSVGLLDRVCTPLTIFALYNHLDGDKDISVYPEYGHEGIDHYVDQQIVFFAERILNVEGFK